MVLNQEIAVEITKKFAGGEIKIIDQRNHEAILGKIKKIELAGQTLEFDFHWLKKTDSVHHPLEWQSINTFNFYTAEISFYRVSRLNDGKKIMLHANNLEQNLIVLYSKQFIKDRGQPKPAF